MSAKTQSTSKPKLVLIGNGMAGAKLLEELVETCPNKYDVTVFGNEPYGTYNRIMLSPLLAGDKTLDDIMINGRDWYEQHNLTLHAGPDKEIIEIDRIHKRVVCRDGSQAKYDRLVIATGSKPFILPIEGTDLNGVMSFRDVADVNAMIQAAGEHKRAVVIGAGLLGLEAAMGLSIRGMQVTVVHSNTVPLNRQLDAEAGELLKTELEARGLAFEMDAKTQAIIDDGQGNVSAVHIADGRVIPADIVIMAIGIRPNVALAKAAELHCDKGIVVSDTLQTYDPSIYALGECIQHRGDTFGLVAPLYDQAKVLANHLSEHGVAQYATLPTATKLKVTGISLYSVGDFMGDDDSECLIYRDKHQSIYKKVVLKDNRIVGAVMYGDTLDGPYFQELMDAKQDIRAIRPQLMFGKALCEQLLATNKVAP